MCRQLGELRPPGAGGAGLSDPCLPGGNGMDLTTNLTPFQEKVDSVKSRKSCITMKISHCTRLTLLRAIHRMS